MSDTNPAVRPNYAFEDGSLEVYLNFIDPQLTKKAGAAALQLLRWRGRHRNIEKNKFQRSLQYTSAYYCLFEEVDDEWQSTEKTAPQLVDYARPLHDLRNRVRDQLPNVRNFSHMAITSMGSECNIPLHPDEEENTRAIVGLMGTAAVTSINENGEVVRFPIRPGDMYALSAVPGTRLTPVHGVQPLEAPRLAVLL